MSIDWPFIERALYSWIDELSPDAVEDASIIWAEQNIDQPAYPFITLKKNNFAIIEGGAGAEIRTASRRT